LKQAEWRDRCAREHEQGGEVTGLTLTPASSVELVNEVLGDPGGITWFPGEDGSPDGERQQVTAGARISHMDNEAAGNKLVEIEIDPDADTVTVRDADGSVRTVAFAAA
jgi:hypothetical protein